MTPTTPQINALLAFDILSVSPKAVRKIMPAITNATTAIIVKTIHAALAIPSPMLEMLEPAPPPSKPPYTIAKEVAGRADKMPATKYREIFFVLLIILITRLMLL